MPEIQIRYDRERGCGWRDPGGLYLVTEGAARGCGLMPFPLTKCCACGQGVKPSRGWTWIEPAMLFDQAPQFCEQSQCESCPMAVPRRLTLGRAGLLWCGTRYYPKPEHWLQETIEQGVSRRISGLPRGFEVGKTWVYMAHRDVERDLFNAHNLEETDDVTGAIVYVFLPTAVEYVVRGDESEEQLEQLEERGITLVRVVKCGKDGKPLDGSDKDLAA